MTANSSLRIDQTSGPAPTSRGKAIGPVLREGEALGGVRKGEMEEHRVVDDKTLEAARALLSMFDGTIESDRGEIEEGRRSSQPQDLGARKS